MDDSIPSPSQPSTHHQSATCSIAGPMDDAISGRSRPSTQPQSASITGPMDDVIHVPGPSQSATITGPMDDAIPGPSSQPSTQPLSDSIAGPIDDAIPSPSSLTSTQDQSATTTDAIVKSKGIGPYASAVGLNSDHFSKPIRDGMFPHVAVIKNGLVLELYEYLTIILGYPAISVTHLLCKLNPQESVNEIGLNVAVKRLWQKRVKVVRNRKLEAKDRALKDLKEGEFKLVRKRVVKSPDTPRKKKLRLELQSEKFEHSRSKRKLSVAESSMADMSEKLMRKTGIEEELHREKEARKLVQAHLSNVQVEVDSIKEKLNDTINLYDNAMRRLNEMNLNFNPMKDDLEDYKKRYDAQEKQVTALKKQYTQTKTKLGSLSTRNVNKRIKNRDAKYLSEKEKNDDLVREKKTLNDMLYNMKEELKDTNAKLSQCERDRNKLNGRLTVKSTQKTKVHKQNWKLLKQRESVPDRTEIRTEHDMTLMENRISMLRQKNKELQELISLMEDADITTFQDGKYTDDVRETVMALLSMNVATSKINDVIRIILKKLAKKAVDRLPSAGTISEIRLEARHLADLEVGLAMRENRPEDALGNCIHGDGTTKYHKKYQNFQVSLPDGSTRSMGLTQMAAADTQAVVDAYKERIRELSSAISSVEDCSEETIYEELLCTVKSAMTDQGPTMPQFGDRLKIIREGLLPKITTNWENLPTNVKIGMADFGQFYCKMHPLINFAEEANRVLKSLEDISTSGKNIHTLLTAEAGATRLIRTASKAFHHRGCDKSGIEDAFTTYLEFEYGTTNHLVNYVGNRANILFEGAAAAFYHLDHMINFVGHLPDPNNLLLAVSEDAQEKIHRAELRALGIVFKCVTEPLWTITKSVKNILSLNKPLHYLQMKLTNWKEDASELMKGEMGIEGAVHNSDDLSEVLFADCPDGELHGMTQQALELLCCAILLILERQCKDQLPGGKYWDPAPDVQERFTNVPTTNVVGERDFAWLDFLVREKPNARTITLETIIMWANNGTRAWLDGLDQETKAMYMEKARAHAPEILQRYKEKMCAIKKYRWEQLQQKQRDKAAKEERQVASRIKLTNEITAEGGVWCTEAVINEKCAKLNDNNSDEEVRRAIYTQLSFHQKILKSKTPKKEYFQLTTTTDGRNRKFTKTEMQQHLINIVQANNLPSDPTDLELLQSTPQKPVTYTDTKTQQEKYNEVKQKMFEKISSERQKRAIQHSKMFLHRLINNPELLVNKRVQHKCIDPHNVARWFSGLVTNVTPFHSDDTNVVVSKTVYEIHYEESQLEEDEPSVETFPLLVDLKKNDLIIVDPLA